MPDAASNKVVLITGASRGFGQAAALKCLERGHTVIATMRDPARDGATLTDRYANAELHQLDVTENTHVQQVVQAVAATHGRIDVLVNNAGYGLFGPVEEMNDAEVQREFDTNFFGQLRMVRAVMPVMRASGGGKIVNFSSIGGRIVGPTQGIYCATKYAIEAMSEALRYEVSRWNVQVTILEPGMYRSDWQTTGLAICEKVQRGESAYQRSMEESLRVFRETAASRPGSDAVGVAVADIVDLVQPLPLHWPVGEDAVRRLNLRARSTDEQWEQYIRSSAGHRTAFFAG
jgi:NAD(P)-dependent dehydrogenase (short-subunit alcohol dehydrogenase family)